MAKAKYILSFFLFLSAFLFIGESRAFYLENFQDSYSQVGYFLETGGSEAEMNRKIQEKAEEFDSPVFTLEKTEDGAFSRRIVIYGDREA